MVDLDFRAFWYWVKKCEGGKISSWDTSLGSYINRLGEMLRIVTFEMYLSGRSEYLGDKIGKKLVTEVKSL